MHYVALGDSFSSGEGVEPFEPSTSQDPACHQSRDAYPRLVAAEPGLGVDLVGFLACSGAKTANVTSTAQHGGQTQASNLAALEGVDLVTLTIGGNDIGFSAFLKACLAGDDLSCGTAFRVSLGLITDTLPGLLAESYTAIRDSAGPDATILVLGYPRIVPDDPESCRAVDPSLGLLTPARTRWAQELTTALNATIEAAVARAGTNFVFLDPTGPDSPFEQGAGHTLCGTDPYFNGPDPFHPEYSYHPNRSGHRAYATMVIDYLKGRVASPSGTPTASECSPSGAAIHAGIARIDTGGEDDIHRLAMAGVDALRCDLKIEISESTVEFPMSVVDSTFYAPLMHLCAGGRDPVIALGALSFLWVDGQSGADNGPLVNAARDCPATKFAVVHIMSGAIPELSVPNVASLAVADEQTAFLVGAAAALKSASGRVGFVGGCQTDAHLPGQAGFVAGARAANPDIGIEVRYLATPDKGCGGAFDERVIRDVLTETFSRGADIVYLAGTDGGMRGAFDAARSSGGRLIVAYEELYARASAADQTLILTAPVNRYDVLVSRLLTDVAAGRFTPGTHICGAREGCVGYSRAGGAVDDVASELDAYLAAMASGSIVVPTTPQ